MGIFRRITDIVAANLNDMTEGFENPEKLLKLAIREMRDSIADATQQTAKAIAHEKTLARELENNRNHAAKWRDHAAQAAKAGDDRLARKALSRKLEHETIVAALTDQLEASQRSTDSIRRQLNAMRAKLAEAERNLANLSVRHRAAEFRKKLQTTEACIPADFDRNAFAKFERLRERVERAEAEAEALAELKRPEPAEPCLAADLETNDEAALDAELLELKRELKLS